MGITILKKAGVTVVVTVFACLLAGTGFAQPQGKGPAGHGGDNFIGMFDKNSDGKVGQDEFNGPADRFSMFDKNQDGFITDDEAPAGPPGADRGKGGQEGKGKGGPEGKGPDSLPVI
jgi:hypothetical protein